MKYFVLQVKSTREDVFMQRVQKTLAHRPEKQRLFFPKRRLNIRRGGKVTKELKPLFSGYIFIESEEIDTELYRLAKKTPDFFRFLKDNHHIVPLTDKDLDIIRHFESFGEVAEPSKVFFDESDQIVVREGPLKGIEGSIVKVDKRKRRAKVQVVFSDTNFLLDLAFEVIEKDKKEEGADEH
jgi:transcriptional antiterminator NusG